MNYKTDVLIIGTGGAGLRAAIEAADAGTKALLVGKTLLGKAHTVMAEGGINAALGNVDPDDTWKVHFKDTIMEGLFLNDWRMVDLMTRTAPDIIKELESFGALFDRTPKGKIMQRAFGGATYRRTCHIADRTGLEIIQVLMAEVKRRKIKSIDEVIITKLVTKKRAVIGAIGIELRTGKILTVTCKSIILATGGHARIYKRSTNAWETVGDGYTLAMKAGAALQDMEMVQFHPTGMVYPESVEGVLVTESVRGEGGILRNAKGERFMKKYDPKRMELSTRDVVARANYQEIMEGRGTKLGGVWLDISHKPRAFIEKKLPKMIQKFKDFADVDITKEPMEVAPTAHYAMGGIHIHHATCQTNIKGLFAAGEAAAGIHGANRLGGNSLIDILVFGKLSGEHAAQYAKKAKYQKVSQAAIKKEEARLFAGFTRKGERPIKLIREVKQLMWKHVGIVRDEKSLEQAVKMVNDLKKRLSKLSVSGSKAYNHELAQYIHVTAMIPTCEAIIKSALLRKESRGAHYRKDHPKTDKKWVKNILVTAKAGKLKLITKPVPKSPNLLTGET